MPIPYDFTSSLLIDDFDTFIRYLKKGFATTQQHVKVTNKPIWSKRWNTSPV